MSDTKVKLFACDRKTHYWDCDWVGTLQDSTLDWESVSYEEMAELQAAVRAANDDKNLTKHYMLVEQCPDFDRKVIFKSLSEFKEKVKKDEENREKEKKRRAEEREAKLLSRKRKQLEKLQKELGAS